MTATGAKRPWQFYRDRAISRKKQRPGLQRQEQAGSPLPGSWLSTWNKSKQEVAASDARKKGADVPRGKKIYAVCTPEPGEDALCDSRNVAESWLESRSGARMRIFWNEVKAKEWISSVWEPLAPTADEDAKNSLALAQQLQAWALLEQGEDAEKHHSYQDRPAEAPSRLGPFKHSTESGPAEVTAVRKTRKAKLPPTIELSDEQKEAERLAVEHGASLFITGGAGTGKSVLIREIVKAFQKRNYEIAVTATTGIAGLNIAGSTVHSWSGIGLGNGTPQMMVDKIKSKRDLRLRWQNVEVLVIDEVSMLDGLLFDKLEAVARIVREDARPFGGIQLILCGDFFQLPPVVVETRTNGHLDPELEQKRAYLKKRGSYKSNFVFDAQTWSKCVRHTIFLKRVFRQTEKDLVHHLDCLRRGHVDSEIVKFFAALDRPIDCSDGIMPTELFSKKKEVEAANLARLYALHGFPYRFKASDTVNPECLQRISAEEQSRYRGIYLSELKRSTIAPEHIELRAGAQVMLTKNLTNGLVNGSIGVILGFVSTQDRKVTKDADGNLWFRSDASKGPVQIAQSAIGSKNRAVANIVAEMEGKSEMKAPSASSLPLFAAQVKELADDSLRANRKWPLVRFSKGLAKDETVEMLITPMAFDFESAVSGKTVATRQQVPLILAWAMSIHKGQGQTLPRVKVNLGSVFESGQAYVAISRATCIEGLQVINFSPEKIFADDRVVEWYADLNRKTESQSDRNDTETAKVDAADGDEEVVEEQREDYDEQKKGNLNIAVVKADPADDEEEVTEIKKEEFYRADPFKSEVEFVKLESSTDSVAVAPKSDSWLQW